MAFGRESVTKGWRVVARPAFEAEKTRKDGLVVVSGVFRSPESAMKYRDLFQSTQGRDCWVESIQGFEIKKGAPVPLIV